MTSLKLKFMRLVLEYMKSTLNNKMFKDRCDSLIDEIEEAEEAYKELRN